MNTKQCRKELAQHLTKRSACKVKMSAVISDKEGRVLSWGWNSSGNGSGQHAEEMALKRANPARLKGATVTVAGFRKKNCVLSMPCLEKCFPRLVAAGISTIEYTDKEGNWHECNLHGRH